MYRRFMVYRGYLMIFGMRHRGVWLGVLLALATAPSALAAVTGSCSNCHTMHYSQDGGILSEWSGQGPHQSLLTTTCIGCHTGSNRGGDTPFVFSISAPLYDSYGVEMGTDTLAGGNFYWVTQAGGDNRGHNVAGLAPADPAFPVPPGFEGGRAAADGSIPGGGGWPAGQQVTCAGVYGCHGSHAEAHSTSAIKGGHHKGQSGHIVPSDPFTADSGYRMLVGVAGNEDSAWEYQPTPSRHNQYKGVDSPEVLTDLSTIGSMCARCHGQYHDGSGNVGSRSPWVRHPTDYDMGNTAVASEYRDYGGSGVNTYQVGVPLASVDVSSVHASVSFADDTIVTCLSCHRAHGSPWYRAMRWDYVGNPMGGGCAICHTSKD